MSEEKKKYRVTNPVAWGGRRERGEILELTAQEAVEIGEVEPVELDKAPVEAPAAPAEKAPEPTGDYAPVNTPDELAAEAKVETEAEPAAPASAPEETPAAPAEEKTDSEIKS